MQGQHARPAVREDCSGVTASRLSSDRVVGLGPRGELMISGDPATEASLMM